MNPHYLLREERTAHFSEFTDFLPEVFLRNVEMFRKAGKTEKTLSSAIDHFFRKSNFVPFKRTSTLKTDRQKTAGLLLFIFIDHVL